MSSIGRVPTSAESKTGVVTICGLILGACVLGGVIAAAGLGTSSQIIIAGVFAVLVIVGATCLVLDLPVVVVVRFAFIASFFFKGDLNLLKINEIEDPSGLNLSLTLLTGGILLFHDLVFDTKRERVLSPTFLYLSGALFVCATLSVMYNGSTTLGWFSLFSFLTSVFIAFVIASHFSERERLVQLITGTAAGVFFTGAVALSQYVFDFPTTYAALGTGTEEELLGTQSQILSRVPAFLRTPTEMAWVISSLVPIIIAPIIYRVKRFSSSQKIYLLAAALSGTVGIILSLARGSWISLIVSIVIPVIFGWFRLRLTERKTYVIYLGFACILACLFLAPFALRIYDRLNNDDQGSALIRVPLMETALRIIEDNPLVGVGLNGYRDNMTRYDETGIFVSQAFPNPVHNVFAHITAEIGIPGGIIFCLLILVALYECFKSLNASDALLCAIALGTGVGIIAFVISAMKEPGSLGSVRPPIRTLFFLFGAALAVSRMRRRLLF